MLSTEIHTISMNSANQKGIFSDDFISSPDPHPSKPRQYNDLPVSAKFDKRKFGDHGLLFVIIASGVPKTVAQKKKKSNQKVELDYRRIRQAAVEAMFTDNDLAKQVVLKGGNALALVYKTTERVSLDLDFSLEGDFEDLDETVCKIERALNDRFEALGLKVHGCRMTQRPRKAGTPEHVLGYCFEYKLATMEDHGLYASNQLRLNMASLTISDDTEHRRFEIDFSKNEFTGGKVRRLLEGMPIYVYSLEMIAIEKLRALCQQRPDVDRTAAPRPRDFYDIHSILAAGLVELTTEANRELAQKIFSAKQVPLSTLRELAQYKDFHEQDWPSVIASIPTAQAFDFYFEYVLAKVQELEALWNE